MTNWPPYEAGLHARGGLHAFVNQAQWEELPRPYKAAVEAASQAATLSIMAAYDARNPEALIRPVAAGAPLRAFPVDTVDALHRASQELCAELSASNAAFRHILEARPPSATGTTSTTKSPTSSSTP